jgi:acyl-coenzyme A synthetase/AMP-(fatty) acid ligase
MSAAYPHLRHLIGVGGERTTGWPSAVTAWEHFVAGGEVAPDALVQAAAAEVRPADDAVIIYTSGSTARPKGVLQSHQAAARQSWRFARHLGVDGATRTWSAFPLFWTAGFAMIMGATLAGGGTLVLQERFEAGEALRILSAQRVTAAPTRPTRSRTARRSTPEP